MFIEFEIMIDGEAVGEVGARIPEEALEQLALILDDYWWSDEQPPK